MTRTEIVPETFVYSPFIHTTWRLAREYLIGSSRRESFNFARIKHLLNWECVL